MDAPAPRQKLTVLYASPVRAGFAALFLLTVGLGLAGLPLYQAINGAAGPLTSQTLIAAFAFLIFGGLIAWPGYQFARAIALRSPLMTTDGTVARRVRMGFGTTEIAWADVGDLGLRGVWIILVDGRTPQSKFGQSMFGAKGLWIPALFVDGGGAKTVEFIADHRPDLIDPVVGQVEERTARRKRK